MWEEYVWGWGAMFLGCGELKTPIGHLGGNVHLGTVEINPELQAEV